MTAQTIQIMFGDAPMETSGYQAEGHLYACKHPNAKDVWLVVHKPTGLALDPNYVGMVQFRTKRKAMAVAKQLATNLPELAEKARIKTFIARNKGKVKNAFSHACWRNALV